jgi:hypothetical protein
MAPANRACLFVLRVGMHGPSRSGASGMLAASRCAEFTNPSSSSRSALSLEYLVRGPFTHTPGRPPTDTIPEDIFVLQICLAAG